MVMVVDFMGANPETDDTGDEALGVQVGPRRATASLVPYRSPCGCISADEGGQSRVYIMLLCSILLSHLLLFVCRLSLALLR